MKRSGFTIVELVVVIAVITVLAGILMPVLRTIKQKTRMVVCGSNLRQLLLTLTIYERENDVFPYGFDNSQKDLLPKGGYPGSGKDGQGWWWFNFLPDIVRDGYDKSSILWCPSRYVETPQNKKYVLFGSYGVNRAVCRDATGILGTEFLGSPLGFNQISRPAETLLITDSGYSLISWRAAAEATGTIFENTNREEMFYLPGLEINSERELSSDYRSDAINGRHPCKTVNIGFADGHEERVKANDLLVEKDQNGHFNIGTPWKPTK